MSTLKQNLKKLISFKTINNEHYKDERALEACWKFIDSQVLQIPGWTYTEYVSNGFKSRVYSHKDHVDTREFDALLYGHIDIVAAEDTQFVAKEEGNRLVGRGAIDMKAATAVNIEVLKNLPDKLTSQKIALIITTDEEIGGYNGVHYLLGQEGYSAPCVILPDGKAKAETYNFELKNKGIIWTNIEARGIAAHAGRKHQGINANEVLVEIFTKLKERHDKGDKDKWQSTLNLGKIYGGISNNSTADEAYMQLDLRYTTEQEAKEFMKDIDEIKSKYDVEIEHPINDGVVCLEKDSECIKKYYEIACKHIDCNKISWGKSVAGSDARHFASFGIKPIIFMPRSEGNHTDYEWVNMDDLEKFVNINCEFLQLLIK